MSFFCISEKSNANGHLHYFSANIADPELKYTKILDLRMRIFFFKIIFSCCNTHGNALVFSGESIFCGFRLSIHTWNTLGDFKVSQQKVKKMIIFSHGKNSEMCLLCANTCSNQAETKKKMKTSENFRSLHTWLYLSENHF